ncbi:hypothetical protein EUX98_g1532 [Antrodiella citrinella]|uniref:GmrSD restriction endonucleases N-terminal domain-containing protein n=1 Tax=Antrodiella citrinella TaxID=2447956 RepID=A0A4S4N3J4_9APHY|nr:hypothetical protein EUX98_g1532 [Antrodiella citrinella]
MRNYYIPPIIFVLQRLEDGSELRRCIDGKQRLTSITRFMQNEIKTWRKFWCQKNAGRHQVISKATKQNFENKQIVCMEYDDLTEEQEREIFQRVQMGVALTPAERLAALTGDWASLTRDVQDEIFSEKFGADLGWGTSHGRDIQAIAGALCLMVGFPETKHPTVSLLDKWLQQTETKASSKRRELMTVFKMFAHMASDDTFNACFGPENGGRMMAVEFPMIAVLISVYQDKMSFAQLSDAIAAMRLDVRLKHAEMKNLKRVTMTMWAFLNKGFKKYEKPRGDRTAASVFKSLLKEQKVPVVKAEKRKRTEDSDAEDDDAAGTKTRSAKARAIVKPEPTPKFRKASATKSAVKSSTAATAAAKTTMKRTAKIPQDLVGPSASNSTVPDRQTAIRGFDFSSPSFDISTVAALSRSSASTKPQTYVYCTFARGLISPDTKPHQGPTFRNPRRERQSEEDRALTVTEQGRAKERHTTGSQSGCPSVSERAV